MRVLVVIPNPINKDMTPVMAAEEFTGLAQSIAFQNRDVTLVPLHPPTWSHLHRLLSNHTGYFDVVHFIGHGESNGIWLEDEFGREEFIIAEDLANALIQSDIKLAVLNVCESEIPARKLVDAGISTVIGTKDSIRNDEAIELAKELYASLASENTVANAMNSVRNALHRLNNSRNIPILFGDEHLSFSHTDSEWNIPEIVAFSDQQHNLRIINPFFGRHEELLFGLQLLASSECRGIEITGIGGVGKSVFGIQLAYRSRWRFYGGVLFVDCRHLNHISITDTLISKFNKVLYSRYDQPMKNLQDIIYQMNSQATLIVVDQIEELEEEEIKEITEIIGLLNPLAGSKIILIGNSSIQPEENAIASIHISDLDKRYVVQFIDHLAGLHDKSEVKNDIDLWNELADKCHGNPKFIQVSLGLLNIFGIQKGLDILDNLDHPLPAALENIVGKIIRNLDEQELRHLMVGTLFTYPFKTDGIASILELDSSSNKYIQTLVYSNLFERYPFTSEFSVPSIIVDYIKTNWEYSEDLLVGYGSYILRQINSITELSQRNHSKVHGLDRYVDEVFNILNSLMHLGTQLSKELLINLIHALRDYLHFERQDWKLIEHFELKAEKACRDLDRRADLGSILTSLASSLAAQAEFDPALRYCIEGIKLLDESKDLVSRSIGYGGLGYVHKRMGNIDDAQRAYQIALELAEQTSDVALQTRHISNLGHIARLKNDWAEALSKLELALEKASSIGDTRSKWIIKNNIADVAIASGNPEKAILYYETDIDKLGKETNLKGQQIVLLQLGRIYRRLGSFDEAISYYQRANTLARQLHDWRGISICERGLCLLYRELENYELAYKHISTSIQITEKYSLKPYRDLYDIRQSLENL